MEHSAKKSKLTYKQLFSYSLVIIGLLIIAMPVLAHSQMTSPWLTSTPNVQVEPATSTKTPLIEGINANHVPAGQEKWYYYEAGQFQPANFAWVSLTLRYQSEMVIEPSQFNFEVLSTQQVEAALSGQPLGQGKISIQSVEQGFTEMFWTARMNGDDAFYVRVFNRSPIDLNYNLEANIEPPAVSGAIPASYSDDSPTTIESPPLNIRQLSWQLTAQAVDGMSADRAARWLQQAQALGWISPQGVPAKPDLSAADPELLWHLVAQAISGLDGQATTEWLTQADALGWLAVPPGTLKDFNIQPPVTPPDDEASDSPANPAPPATPEPAPYQPVSIYPNNPLEFRFDEVNSGRLPPYGVHWYSLILSDLDDEIIEDFEITMFTTPSNGFIDSRVNFALFPANQYHIWGRGTTNDMTHFGLGMWLSRDQDDHTGERLWSGSLVDGDRYLVKVKNDSLVEVDYYLFAGDIENAELGNPKLHQMDGSLMNQSVAE